MPCPVPQVSVIIPAYNIRDYLGDALTSLQRQSLADFEALVVDDGSTDDTAAIAQVFCQGDSRFKLLQKPNGGLASARNYGMYHARAPYLALLDGDDIYEPEKLASHVAVLDREPEVGVVYSASRIILENGRPTWVRLSGQPIHPDPLLALLCKNFVGHGSNAVFRRCIVAEAGEFDQSLRSSEDVDFWIRVAALRHWRFHLLPRPLCGYRLRPSGLSFNVAQMQSCNERVLEKAYERSPALVGPMLPTARAYLYRYLARLALAAGQLPEARRLIDRAWEADAGIFWRDPRSLLTLMAVSLSPVTRLILRQSFGLLKST